MSEQRLATLTQANRSPAHPVRIPARSELEFRDVIRASIDAEARERIVSKHGVPPDAVGALMLVGWMGPVEHGRVVAWDHRKPDRVSTLEPRIFDGNIAVVTLKTGL